MIELNNLNNSIPYLKFNELYCNASKKNQAAIEAISISSFSKENNEVESRFVNLKYVDNDKWVFFSNYDSVKAQNFSSHEQISALIYWSSIDAQIRMKALIKKLDPILSDQHFRKRTYEKNSLAISSKQSKKINSYDDVIQNYENVYTRFNEDTKRPSYWGGYEFTPYYFEFWKGNENRINKRDVYKFKNNIWHHNILQP